VKMIVMAFNTVGI